MDERTCATCIYLDKQDPPPAYDGRCRCNPPFPSDSGAAVWPAVRSTDWCGDWDDGLDDEEEEDYEDD